MPGRNIIHSSPDAASGDEYEPPHHNRASARKKRKAAAQRESSVSDSQDHSFNPVTSGSTISINAPALDPAHMLKWLEIIRLEAVHETLLLEKVKADAERLAVQERIENLRSEETLKLAAIQKDERVQLAELELQKAREEREFQAARSQPPPPAPSTQQSHHHPHPLHLHHSAPPLMYHQPFYPQYGPYSGNYTMPGPYHGHETQSDN